jgi:GAF domain-containing protein
MRARLGIGLAIATLLLLITGGIFFQQITTLANTLVELQTAERQLSIVLEARHWVAGLILTIQSETEREVPSSFVEHVRAAARALDDRKNQLIVQAAYLPEDDPLRLQMNQVVEDLQEILDLAIPTTQYAEDRNWTAVRIRSQRLLELHRQAEWDVYRMVTTARERRHKAQEQAIAVARRLVTGPTLAIVFLLVIVALVTVVNVEGVIREIERLSISARRLAEGRFDERVPITREDEFGQLARTFNLMAAQLEELYASLEQRVAERTEALRRRTAQLEAAAVVAREAAAIRDVDTLLDEAVRLISSRFGFYHAGIFLVDEAGEYAILRAASSEGGRRMLARGHKLAVGRVGIVGYVAGTGEPRIALDVGEDAVFFDNPDLPLTRSEMALPLRVHGRVIGVLDVQSEEPAAFSEEDIAVLQVMADQIALAIENARLLEESQRTLRELERLYGERVREAWQRWIVQRPAAYRYTGVAVEPLSEPVRPAGDGTDSRRLTIPIRLWGQTIGTILLRRTEEQPPWSLDERRLAEEIGEQIALALESARLLEETQERAAREQMLSEMTAQLTRSLDVETLLQTALRELARLPEVDEIAVYLGPEEGDGRKEVQVEAGPADED